MVIMILLSPVILVMFTYPMRILYFSGFLHYKVGFDTSFVYP